MKELPPFDQRIYRSSHGYDKPSAIVLILLTATSWVLSGHHSFPPQLSTVWTWKWGRRLFTFIKTQRGRRWKRNCYFMPINPASRIIISNSTKVQMSPSSLLSFSADFRTIRIGFGTKVWGPLWYINIHSLVYLVNIPLDSSAVLLGCDVSFINQINASIDFHWTSKYCPNNMTCICISILQSANTMNLSPSTTAVRSLWLGVHPKE